MELAAPYTNGIVRNHPFVDGNKRTGYSVAVGFLTTGRMKEAVVNLAEDSLSEEGFAAFLGNAVSSSTSPERALRSVGNAQSAAAEVGYNFGGKQLQKLFEAVEVRA